MQWGNSILCLLCIRIRTFGNKQIGDILVSPSNCLMQRRPSILIHRIHIRASSDVLFNGFDISAKGSIVN